MISKTLKGFGLTLLYFLLPCLSFIARLGLAKTWFLRKKLIIVTQPSIILLKVLWFGHFHKMAQYLNTVSEMSRNSGSPNMMVSIFRSLMKLEPFMTTFASKVMLRTSEELLSKQIAYLSGTSLDNLWLSRPSFIRLNPKLVSFWSYSRWWSLIIKAWLLASQME